MAEKRDSFVFYRSFYEAIKELPRDVQGEVLTTIMEYGLNGETTENLKPVAKAIFTLIKPQIDANNKRFLNGSKGGAPKGNSNAKKQPKNNLKTTEPQPNVNDNANVHANENEKENVLPNGNINNDAFFDECKNPSQWMETVCMQNGLTNNLVINKLSEFMNHLIIVQEQKKTLKDFKEHFSNWLRVSKKDTPKTKSNFNSPVL